MLTDSDQENYDLLRRTPRRVRFGGEIVKLRTPDSDSNQPSDDNDAAIVITPGGLKTESLIEIRYNGTGAKISSRSRKSLIPVRKQDTQSEPNSPQRSFTATKTKSKSSPNLLKPGNISRIPRRFTRTKERSIRIKINDGKKTVRKVKETKTYTDSSTSVKRKVDEVSVVNHKAGGAKKVERLSRKERHEKQSLKEKRESKKEELHKKEQEHPKDGHYKKEEPYKIDGQHKIDGQYKKEGQYKKDGEYKTDGQYKMDAQYKKNGQLKNEGKYKLERQYKKEDQYNKDGQYENESQYRKEKQSKYEHQSIKQPQSKVDQQLASTKEEKERKQKGGKHLELSRVVTSPIPGPRRNSRESEFSPIPIHNEIEVFHNLTRSPERDQMTKKELDSFTTEAQSEPRITKVQKVNKDERPITASDNVFFNTNSLVNKRKEPTRNIHTSDHVLLQQSQNKAVFEMSSDSSMSKANGDKGESGTKSNSNNNFYQSFKVCSNSFELSESPEVPSKDESGECLLTCSSSGGGGDARKPEKKGTDTHFGKLEGEIVDGLFFKVSLIIDSASLL